MIWHLLTRFWEDHDLLFTHFGSFSVWVRWNQRHFEDALECHPFHAWQALWGWVNIHG